MEEFRALTAAANAMALEKSALDARVLALEKSLREVRREGEMHASERDGLKTECRRLEAVIANLEARLGALAESAAKPEDGPNREPTFTVKGQVLAADGELGIYLVSIGKRDGVKIADEITVFRGDQFVAQVVVEKVFHDKSSVVVRKVQGKALAKSEIKTGDSIVGAAAGPPLPEMPARPVKGVVLAVDPEKDIYLLSVGAKDGVAIGDEITVYRGDSFVAVIVVEKLLEDRSSGSVKRIGEKLVLKSAIRMGDKAARVE